MNNTLLFRITLFTTLVILLTGAGVGFMVQQTYEERLIQKEEQWMEREVQQQEKKILQHIELLQRSLLSLRNATSIQNIIKTHTDKNSFVSKIVFEAQHDYLAQDLQLILQHQPLYRQIRLITVKNGGKEMVRVEQNSKGEVWRVSDEKLQEKGNRAYVQEAAKLPDGKLHLSELNLNRENGVISTPQQPMLRASTPLYGMDGNVFAVLVINVDFTSILREFQESMDHKYQAYLVNDSGSFLSHPNSQENFSFELGNKHTLQEQITELTPVFDQKKDPQISKDQILHALEKEQHWTFYSNQDLIHFKKLQFDSEYPQRFFGVLVKIPAQKLYSESVLLRTQSLLSIFFIILLGIISAYFFTKRITQPLEELSEGIRRISEDDDEILFPKSATVEVLNLVHVFTEMLQKAHVRRQKLQENEMQTQLIIENIPLLIAFLDTEQRYLFTNKRYADFVQWAPEELQGRQIQEVLGERYSTVSEQIQTVLSGKDISFETQVEHAVTHELCTLKVSYVSHKIRGVARGFFVFIDNITQDKFMKLELRSAKEEAEQASRAKSEFLMNMSHEIRTPLNSIVGFSQILLNAQEQLNLDSEHLGFIRNMKIAGEHLSELINNILDLAKVEAGKITLSEEDLNLKQLVQGMYHINKPQALEKKLRYNFDIDAQLPEFIYADRSKLNQVLMNLLGNAVKFTPEGKGLSLLAKLRDEKLILEVVDEGIGIPEDRQAAIFEAFEQADGSTTRRFGGTGLGLAITKEMVELMGGHISVSSKEGQGSTFCVELPLKHSHVVEEKESICSLQELPSFSANNVILVAEDNLLNQKMIEALFKSIGLNIHFADNGKQSFMKALELKTAGRLDLILMDMHMPVMDGLACKKQLQQFPEVASIPVVAFSADAFSEQRKQALQQGFVDYLTKPLDFKKLYPVLTQYLEIDTTPDSEPPTSLEETSPSLKPTQEQIKEIETHFVALSKISIFQTDELLEHMDSLKTQCRPFTIPCTELFTPLENAIFDADASELIRLLDSALEMLEQSND